jgi:ABC-type dipeptide/oligopeptide/nickel transport system permease subunit
MTVFPGLAIMILLLGFSFLGDALRDALDLHIKYYSE